MLSTHHTSCEMSLNFPGSSLPWSPYTPRLQSQRRRDGLRLNLNNAFMHLTNDPNYLQEYDHCRRNAGALKQLPGRNVQPRQGWRLALRPRKLEVLEAEHPQQDLLRADVHLS